MFTVFCIQIRILINHNHFIVLHSWVNIPRPILFVAHLYIRYSAAWIWSNTKCSVKAIGSYRCFGVTFLSFTQTVFTDKSRCAHNLIPFSISGLFVQRYPCCRTFIVCHYKHLIRSFCLWQFSNPIRRLAQHGCS